MVLSAERYCSKGGSYLEIFKLFTVAISVLLASALILAGCTSPADTIDLMSGIQGAVWPKPPAELDESFQAPMMDFSWNMFKQTLGDDGNVLISPASIYLALAMTMNGANEDTLQAMQTALSALNLNQEQLNAACRDWISLLRTKTEKTTVSVANSIWFRQDYPVSDAFLRTNADYFDAAARALDFNSSDAVKVINDWVKAQTQDKIDSIVDKIDPDTIMYLINAVYFKSDWTTPFDANKTVRGDFTDPSGTVSVDFMNRTGEMCYVDENGVKGVLLPYDDGRFSFFAVLPVGQDVRDYIDEISGTDITSLIESVQSGQVALSLPKFEVEYENSLMDELTALGMGVAFTSQSDLSRINADGIDELFISEVLHKTYCRVDEKGTEAAAVTSVEITLESMPMVDTEIRFDRPFVYGIIDNASGTPLFLGLLETPQE